MRIHSTIIWKVDRMRNLHKQKYYFIGDKLLSVIKHGFLGSEENVNLNDFQHLIVYEFWCVL